MEYQYMIMDYVFPEKKQIITDGRHQLGAETIETISAKRISWTTALITQSSYPQRDEITDQDDPFSSLKYSTFSAMLENVFYKMTTTRIEVVPPV